MSPVSLTCHLVPEDIRRLMTTILVNHPLSCPGVVEMRAPEPDNQTTAARSDASDVWRKSTDELRSLSLFLALARLNSTIPHSSSAVRQRI